MNVKVDIRELFTAGAHFGHKTSRWHPKMSPFIHSERGGIHVIDLDTTVESLKIALSAVTDMASRGRQILFVSTKQQAEKPIQEAAKVYEQPYVVGRWLGGLLTNNKTISKRIKHLKDLEKRMESGELKQRYSKLEVQRFQEEINGLNIQFGGIKDMPGLPGMVFVVDVNRDQIAVKEAKKLVIPVVALVDSNTDPTLVNYPIPANDDAIKTIELILKYINSAIAEGKARPIKPKTDTTKKSEDSTKPDKARTKSVDKKPVKTTDKPSVKPKTTEKSKTRVKK
jgi:small subunit ribosomal protein S2